MTSSFMAAPFEFAANMVPEPCRRGGVRNLVEVGESAEFVEGESPVQSTGLIEGPIQSGVGNDTPVPADLRAGKLVEGRRAIGEQHVVPAWIFIQLIDRIHVIEKQSR